MNGGSHLPRIGRRGFLLGLTALAVAGDSRLAFANGPSGDARLVVIILRGGMDGMHVVVPYGDPGYAVLRGPLALAEPGRDGGVRDLGGFFGLHPRLVAMHEMFAAGALLPVHAVAGPYRTRSHFVGQDLMESGAAQRLSSGWLNRALAHLPDDPRGPRRGLSLGLDVPLLLRGDRQVGTWAPPRPTLPEPDLYLRMAELLHDDPLLRRGVAEGLRSRGFAAEAMAVGEPLPRGGGFRQLAAAAGRMLAARQGPRVAALEMGGWDTHAGQQERVAPVLGQLDEGLAALRLGLGDAWRTTAVLCMTEFGRTARANGSLGTDHGTGGAAFLAGGAIRGGRVLADWPGLGQGQLFENRDLQPTRDLRAIAKALLRHHLGVPEAGLAAAFPASGDIAAESGLLRG